MKNAIRRGSATHYGRSGRSRYGHRRRLPRTSLYRSITRACALPRCLPDWAQEIDHRSVELRRILQRRKVAFALQYDRFRAGNGARGILRVLESSETTTIARELGIDGVPQFVLRIGYVTQYPDPVSQRVFGVDVPAVCHKMKA
jgi:hypothetical protein